jgi:glycosyltransferase involved in cell wall biosynthesis
VRILCWSEFFRPYVGGIEVLASRLLPALAARGHEITVITSHGHLPLPDLDAFEGVRVRRFPFRPGLRVGDATAILQLTAQVRAFVRQLDPELVHRLGVGPSLLHARAVVRGVPMLLTLQNDLRLTRTSGSGLVGELLRSATWVTTCSETLRTQLTRTVPEVASRVSAIPNAVEPPTRAPSAAPWDPPRLLCLGRLVRQKGFDVAIAAFARLRDRFPHARLTVAGDGPERQALERLAIELGARDRTEFLGMVPPPRVSEVLDAATVVLMPSRFEGLPLVAIEAALAARTVVATPVGGLQEIVVDRETGRLVPADDPAALADAVAELLDQPDQVAGLGARARQRALDRFGLTACVQRYDALYQQLAGSRPGVPAPA